MSSAHHSATPENFSALQLDSRLVQTLTEKGYTAPTPIQASVIPHLMEGKDVIGQSQTGTGKTAAFALPLLHGIDERKRNKYVQVMVLTPTRELAIQVAEAFESFGSHIPGLKILPIYGGKDYLPQIQGLKRGVDIVVGTPGRIMDHIRNGNLDLSNLHSLVLDEADEMLKMGFIDDVRWILDQTPEDRRIALFSATMPSTIRTIAKEYLNEPVEVTITAKSKLTDTIEQFFLFTRNMREKNDALAKILETQTFDGIIIFVRTKVQTVEVSEFLAKLGYKCGPLNGDIPQAQRIRMIEQLKSGLLDIVVATDVAARGIDVERITHVINYDQPFDTEAYIHRIGRTGRAGRKGTAILFLSPREQRLIRNLQKHTGSKLHEMKAPTAKEINHCRRQRLAQDIEQTLGTDLHPFSTLIEEICSEKNIGATEVAAALAKMLHGNTPFFLDEKAETRERRTRSERSEKQRNQQSSLSNKVRGQNSTSKQNSSRMAKDTDTPQGPFPDRRPRHKKSREVEEGMERYRIEVGTMHGVQPGNIVGAIANEADIDSEFIGQISIFEDYSTVDLPYGMPPHILKVLQRARIANKKMQMKRDTHSSHSTGKKTQGKKAKAPHQEKPMRKRGKKREMSQRSHTASEIEIR